MRHPMPLSRQFTMPWDVILRAVRDVAGHPHGQAVSGHASTIGSLPTRRRHIPIEGDPGMEGWRGMGSFRRVLSMGKEKPFADGGGLCSPGRWPPNKRVLPLGLNDNLRDRLVSIYLDAVREASGGHDDPTIFVLKLAAGRLKSNPFPQVRLEEARKAIKTVSKMADTADESVGHGMYLDLITGLLSEFQDPDWAYPASTKAGVNLGVLEALPHTPCVFAQKHTWNLTEDNGDDWSEAPNYRSTADIARRWRSSSRMRRCWGGWSR